jgi:hypothetical protein
MDLYVYYKVQEADAAVLQGAVVAMQAALAATHGVAPLLKRRPQATDGMRTWMEVYPSVNAPFPAALDAAVTQAGLARWIAGARHVEVFEDMPPCA